MEKGKRERESERESMINVEYWSEGIYHGHVVVRSLVGFGWMRSVSCECRRLLIYKPFGSTFLGVQW